MRYYGEVRFRLIGPREECVKYIPRARVILGELWNRDHNEGIIEWTHQEKVLPNGVRIAVTGNDYLPIVEIEVPPVKEEIGNPQALLRLAWLPEGICLTPVNATYPDGWGLPTRTAVDTLDVPVGSILNPPYAGLTEEELAEVLNNATTIQQSPFGTEGGILPQVLLNKFANNKYLDKAGFIQGLGDYALTISPSPPRLRPYYAAGYATEGYTFTIHWQTIYDPLSCTGEEDGSLYWATEGNSAILGQEPGLYAYEAQAFGGTEITSSTLLIAQFSDYYYTNNIFEQPSEQWYCHRPEEMLYGLAADEGCFQETNRIRADAGRGPMYRQLRGHANLARMAVDEVALAGKQYHDSDEFRPGYRHTGARATSGVGIAVAGENLLLQNDFPVADEESGREIARIWESSPPHYANQSSPIWDDEDWPGAEHMVAHINATVDEALYYGTFPPVSGIESSQSFTKHFYWVPVSPHDFENDFGVTGYFGNEQKASRTWPEPEPWVRWGGIMFYMNEVFNDPGFAGGNILGCAAFDDGEGIALRAIVSFGPPTNDARDLDEAGAYITIKALVRKLRATDVYQCEWIVEHERTFFSVDGWFPYPDHARFSRDGTKCVFTIQRLGTSYNSALNYGATNFNTDRSATLFPRYSIVHNFVEYRYDNDLEEWDFVDTPVISPRVSVNCSTIGDENVYERTLKTRRPLYADYDDAGDLQFVDISVDEYTYQRYKAAGPETENHGWRIRKLIFPSGKEVIYNQQWFQDSDSFSDPVEIRLRNWPNGDDTGENYILRIDHLDVIREDIIYTKQEWDQKYLGDSFGIFGTADAWGNFKIEADLGFEYYDEVLDELIPREIITLYESTEPRFLFSHQFQILVEGHEHIYSSNRPSTESYPNHPKIETSKGIYCMDQAPMNWWAQERGGGVWNYYRHVFPTAYAWWEDKDAPSVEIAQYQLKDTTLVPFEAPFGRAPYADFDASIAPALNSVGSFTAGGDNTYPLFNPQIWGSLQTCNIAPQMSDEFNAFAKIVRYEDRRIIYVRTIRKAYGDADNAPTTDWQDVLDGYENIPDEWRILIEANFDLDEAVGMDNVTDIYPLGRI